MDSFDGRRRREGRAPQPPAERRSPRETEPLEQRLDRWMSTGRQLVEGVSGGRPGARPSVRGAEGRPGGGRGGFDGLGRWVEDRLDWLLDDGEDWREPWQESDGRRRDEPPPQRPREPLPQPAVRARPRRRPLEAISRRGNAAVAPGVPEISELQTADPQEWPADDLFSVPRWQRPSGPPPGAEPRRSDAGTEPRDRPAPPLNAEADAPSQGGRPLPRSTRRR